MILRHSFQVTGDTFTDSGVSVGTHYHKREDQYFLFPQAGPCFSFYVCPLTGLPLFYGGDKRKEYIYGELMWMIAEQEDRTGEALTVDLSALLPPMQGDYI